MREREYYVLNSCGEQSSCASRMGCPGAKLALPLLDDLTWTAPSARPGRRPALDLDGGVAALGRFLVCMVHLVGLWRLWMVQRGLRESSQAALTVSNWKKTKGDGVGRTPATGSLKVIAFVERPLVERH